MEMMSRLLNRKFKRGGRCRKFKNGMKTNNVCSKTWKRIRSKVKIKRRGMIKRSKRIKRKRRMRKRKRLLSK